MRSSRSAPDARPADPLDPGPPGFAHRGLHGPGARENTLVAVERALAIGAGIEIDVLLSSDDIPIVLHDCELGRFGPTPFGDPRDVAAMTASDLERARLADGLPIASRLTEVLALVAGKVPVLIEAKADPDRISRPRHLAAAIERAIAGYCGPIGVMSFHPLVPRWFARHAPAIRRGLVVRDSLPVLRRLLALNLAAPHFLAVELAAVKTPWVAGLRDKMPVYSWTIRTPADRETGRVQADALIWEADGRP